MDFDVQTMVKMASFVGAGFCIGLGAIGAALGEGYTAGMANQGISENPTKSGDIIKNMLVGQAVAESAAIFALVIAILLIFLRFPVESMLKAAALLGSGLCMGAGAIGSGIGSGYPAGGACLAISRKPEMSGRLTTTMLIGSAVCQTPAIFSLVLAMMLLFLDFGHAPVSPTWAALLGAGICMGAGAIGSGIGSGFPGGGACLATAMKPEVSGRLTTTMLIGSAVCQTPAIFSLVLAMMLLFLDFGHAPASPTWAALLGAGVCMGFGAIGSGLGSGYPGGETCMGIAKQPAVLGRLTTTMLIGSAVCQTPAIFSMVVALMLLFLNFGGAPVSPTWAALLGAGIATGMAAIGSGMGGGLAAGASCEGIARNPESLGQVTTVMLVGQAVAQTPSIFGLLVSFILMFKVFPEAVTVAAPMAVLGAGICMGFGGIGPGIGNGMTAEGAVSWVARNVEATGVLMRTMLVGQAVSQSTAIYAMVISLVLIFVV